MVCLGRWIMKRRDLVAGLAAAGVAAAAESSGEGSLYIPRNHRVEDRALLHDFMDEFAFADLVTGVPEIEITHIPVLLDRSRQVRHVVRPHLPAESAGPRLRRAACGGDRVSRAALLHLPILVCQGGSRAHLELRRRARERKAPRHHGHRGAAPLAEQAGPEVREWRSPGL